MPRCYPEDLRADIVAAGRAAKAAGRSIYSVAEDHGVSAPNADRVVAPSARRTVVSGHNRVGFGEDTAAVTLPPTLLA